MCHDPKVFLQTLPSLRLKSLPDTSISPFLQFSKPLYQTEASHLYSRTLHHHQSSLGCRLGFSYLIQSSKPLSTSLKRLTHARQNCSFKPPKQHIFPGCHLSLCFADHFGFRQRQLYQKAEAICMPRHPKEYVEDMLFLWPGQTDPLSSTHYPMCSSI